MFQPKTFRLGLYTIDYSQAYTLSIIPCLTEKSMEAVYLYSLSIIPSKTDFYQAKVKVHPLLGENGMHRDYAGRKSCHSTLIARQNEDKRNDAHRMPLNEYMR